MQEVSRSEIAVAVSVGREPHRQLILPIPADEKISLAEFKRSIEKSYQHTFSDRIRVDLLLHPAYLPQEVALPLSEPAVVVLSGLSSVLARAAALDLARPPPVPARSKSSPPTWRVPSPEPRDPEFEVLGKCAKLLAHEGGGKEARPSSVERRAGRGPKLKLSAEERRWMRELNSLSASFSSSGFGDFGGKPAQEKLERQAQFLRAAAARWPHFGSLLLRDGSVVRACSFWKRGRSEYFRVLGRYAEAIACGPEAEKRSLLTDLGFHLCDGFVSEEEEAEMTQYWGPRSELYGAGACERFSRRRFFNYGPVLPRAVEGSTKSTLAVIACAFGGMPELVDDMRLMQRMASFMAQRLNDEHHVSFDQLYVNHYDASLGAHIGFHHDNHLSMRGVIAGVSLGSGCTLRLRAADDPVDGQLAACIGVTLPRRSAYIMSGLSRWHLQHGIPEVKSDRTSLTFRAVDRACARDQRHWERRWTELSLAERRNAQWPCLPPSSSNTQEVGEH